MKQEEEFSYEEAVLPVAAKHGGTDIVKQFREQVRKAPWYLISFAFHGVMLFLATFIVINPVARAEEWIPIVSKIQATETPLLEEPPLKDEIQTEPKVPLFKEVEEVSEVVPIDNLPETEEVSLETDEPDDVAVGEPDNIKVTEVAGDPGLFDVMGVGGGESGGFGRRGLGQQTTGIKIGYPESPSRVIKHANKGLIWLARHQEPDGHWDCVKYGGSKKDGDVGVTGLACLAFLGAGYTPNVKSQFQATIKKGIDWLISRQKPRGDFKNCRNYGNGTGAMALAEAAGMGYYKAEAPAKRALDYLISAQGSEGGWDYTSLHNKPGRLDNSVSGWCIMALKSGYIAGIDFDKQAVWKKFGVYLDKSIKVEEGDDYNVNAKAMYACGDDKGWRAGSTAMQGASLLMVIYHGMRQNHPVLNALAENVEASGLAAKKQRDAYTLYYCTLAMFLTGSRGKYWRNFGKASLPVLLQNQRRGDPSVDGSWDPTGGHDDAGGRVMTTAMKVMCLTVSIKVQQVFDQ